jgi:hypothetical protein
LDLCDKAQWRLHRRPVNVFCKINSFLKRKHTVCRTFENKCTHVVAIDLYTQRLATCLEHTYDYLQGSKMRRRETLRVQNEIREVSEPIHRYKITITRKHSVNTHTYKLLLIIMCNYLIGWYMQMV